MPITISGSGTVTGISAGGLPDACITTDDIAANAVTAAKLGADQASGLAKAWVNFNGTGTVAIRASFNVSSITDNGVSDYTVNFTTAFADANYCITGTAGLNTTSLRSVVQPFNLTNPSTSAVRIQTPNADGSLTNDPIIVSVAIFR